MTTPLAFILLPAAAYLIGAIPFGLVLARLKTGVDIRTVGSGNIGATNARRAGGNALGIAVLACDSLKGLLPILFARMLFQNDTPAWRWAAAAMALAAIIGHMYPVYLKCRASGKGVATAAGCFLYLTPAACLLALAVFLGLAAATRRVSIGSMTASVLLPVLIWFTTRDAAFATAGLLTAGLILIRHKDNLRRLLSGSEPPL